jgi:hypothetical protein
MNKKRTRNSKKINATPTHMNERAMFTAASTKKKKSIARSIITTMFNKSILAFSLKTKLVTVTRKNKNIREILK